MVRIRVIDESGDPIHGASASVMYTQRGGVTDSEGMATISAEIGEQVLVTSVGKKSASFTVEENDLIYDDATYFHKVVELEEDPVFVGVAEVVAPVVKDMSWVEILFLMATAGVIIYFTFKE